MDEKQMSDMYADRGGSDVKKGFLRRFLNPLLVQDFMQPVKQVAQIFR
jgi:hypothetical protein